MLQSFILLILAFIGLLLPVVAQHRAESQQKLEIAQAAEAQPKSAQTCSAEWRANAAAHRAKGLNEKAYVEQCRSAAAGSFTTGAASPPSSTMPPGAGRFTSAAEAKTRCGAKPVVWANLGAKTYAPAGDKAHDRTKKGAYMCETDAKAEGLRAAKR